MGWRDDRSAGQYGAPRSADPVRKDFAADYRRLEAAYRELEAENRKLRRRLAGAEVDPALEAAVETAEAAVAAAKEQRADKELARAQRDLLYEAARMMAEVHDCEHRDGRAWCAECRYEFPCRTRKMADIAIHRVTEWGAM